MAVCHLLDCDNAYLTGTETHLQNVDEFSFSLRGFLRFCLFCLVLLWFLFVMSAFGSHYCLLSHQYGCLFIKV